MPTSVTFGLTDIEKTFTFTATQDSVDDDGESVKLTFGSSLPAGVTKGSTDEAVVSITDDDVPSVEVSFGQGSYTVAEGQRRPPVTVTLNADPERTVTIPITTTEQGWRHSGRLLRRSRPASQFAPGETEQTFAFTADSDSENDDGERVKLTFGSSLPTGVTKGSTDEAVVSINGRRRAVGGGELRAGLLQGGLRAAPSPSR